MAKYRKTFSNREQGNKYRSFFFGGLAGKASPLLWIVAPLSFVAHVAGWLWGELDSGEETSSRKPGLKSPSSYIIIGNLDDIWDDSK